MAAEAEGSNSSASSLVTNATQDPGGVNGGLQSSEPPTPSQTPTPGSTQSAHQNFAPNAAALHLKLSQVKNFICGFFKGGVISEVILLWSYPQKNEPNHCPSTFQPT